MKLFQTTIKTTDQVRAAILNARKIGTFKTGETVDEFAVNVALYIKHCTDSGVRVLPEAYPDYFTLAGWYDQHRMDERYAKLVGIYGPKVARGLHVVEGEYPDGSGDWVQCDAHSVPAVVEHFTRLGCRVYINTEQLGGQHS